MRVRLLPGLRVLFFFIICLSGLLFPALTHAGGSASERYPVAMRSFGVWEAHSGERLDFSVWYPGRSAASNAVREGWIVESAQGGRVLPGFYPLVLVSHDTASGRFANSDLAVALASGGMIVIVPAHTGDNQNASEGIHTALLLRDRPRHLLRALETVLGTPEFAPHADESRIGLLGIGFGAISVMQLAGAAPDFSRLQGYCGSAQPQDAFCAPWTRERLEQISSALAFLEQEQGPRALLPPLALFAPPLVPAALPLPKAPADEENKAALNGDAAPPSLLERLFGSSADSVREGRDMQPPPAGEEGAVQEPLQNAALALDFQAVPLFGGMESGGAFAPAPLADAPVFRFSLEEEVEALRPDSAPITADPAVKAYRRAPELRQIRGIALLAPAGGMLFGRDALAGLRTPVALMEAGRDGLYPPQRHAYPYFTDLPTQPMRLHLPEADHFSLFADCSRDSMLNLGAICGRMVGDARQELSAARDDFLLSFFQSALGGPLPPAEPSGFIADERADERP